MARVGDRRRRGVAAYADDWVGIRSIEIDPAHRRQGLGLAVMAALLELGSRARRDSRRTSRCSTATTPALALYGRLGFRTHHAYRYLAEP